MIHRYPRVRRLWRLCNELMYESLVKPSAGYFLSPKYHDFFIWGTRLAWDECNDCLSTFYRVGIFDGRFTESRILLCQDFESLSRASESTS